MITLSEGARALVAAGTAVVGFMDPPLLAGGGLELVTGGLLTYTNQPINQSINQPTNQSTNQSINQSTH
jgi:hypothetical protein